MRVALVHDWLVTYRGGEKVLEAIAELFPEAPIYTLFYESAKMPQSLRQRDIRVHPANKWLRPFRKLALPLLPSMIESLPLEGYDLVISTSSCVAKGALVGPGKYHLCYIHSPMRYIWDQRSYYLKSINKSGLLRSIWSWISTKLRVWDQSSATRVDTFVANSEFVKNRVKKYYAREALVIHPPVECEAFFEPIAGESLPSGPYFLAAGAFVSYKRFDLAIEACKLASKKLVIAGSGPECAHLQSMAKGSDIHFEIAPSARRWAALFQNAEAFIFPGIEDFGITAIEALASGTPIVAYRAGGALDFVRDKQTGIFFDEQTPQALAEKLEIFEKASFSKEFLQDFARQFSKESFQSKIRAVLDADLEVDPD